MPHRVRPSVSAETPYRSLIDPLKEPLRIPKKLETAGASAARDSPLREPSRRGQQLGFGGFHTGLRSGIECGGIVLCAYDKEAYKQVFVLSEFPKP